MPFEKGKSGNPKGRPVGSKNAMTLLRETVLTKSEELVLKDWNKVVKATVDLAKNGDATCLKILWDRMVPTTKAIDPSKRGGTGGVTIIVQGTKTEIQTPIEGEYTVEEYENGQEQTNSDAD